MLRSVLFLPFRDDFRATNQTKRRRSKHLYKSTARYDHPKLQSHDPASFSKPLQMNWESAVCDFLSNDNPPNHTLARNQFPLWKILSHLYPMAEIIASEQQSMHLSVLTDSCDHALFFCIGMIYFGSDSPFPRRKEISYHLRVQWRKL